MKDQKENTEESIKIPADMMIDIFAILVDENLKHEIIEVLVNRKTVIVAVSYKKDLIKHQKIMQNIQDLLADYEHFRWSENEQTNWREN